MKLFIGGHGDHGKSELAEMMCKIAGIKSVDSSFFVCEMVVRPFLETVHGLKYPTAAICHADRRKHRGKWRKAIEKWNKDDPTRLARAIFKENDIYVGVRSRREYLASKHLADISIWVEAPKRVGTVDESLDIDRLDFDVIVNNDQGKEQLKERAERLCRSFRLSSAS